MGESGVEISIKSRIDVGGCNYCRKFSDHVAVVAGPHIEVRFCHECFSKLMSFGKLGFVRDWQKQEGSNDY